ncbi:MAG: hypothetical protein HY850_02995 [Betaproteobacteria bacterium]|nr:hypothetical protein [Betaproteobacteria bacterium]
MNKTLISLILIAVSGLATAEETPPAEGQPGWQQMFDKLKAIESRSHHGRIRILQEAEDCIQAAKTPPAYRACEQKEAQAREQLREELRPLHEALRKEAKPFRQSRPAEAPAPKL